MTHLTPRCSRPSDSQKFRPSRHRGGQMSINRPRASGWIPLRQRRLLEYPAS